MKPGVEEDKIEDGSQTRTWRNLIPAFPRFIPEPLEGQPELCVSVALLLSELWESLLPPSGQAQL